MSSVLAEEHEFLDQAEQLMGQEGNDTRTLTTLLAAFEEKADTLTVHVNEVSSLLAAERASAVARSISARRDSLQAIVAVCAAALALLLLASRSIGRSILHSIQKVQDTAQDLAPGDFRARAEDDARDEIGGLGAR